MKKLWENKKALGIFLTLLGGSLFGFSGACGQYLFEYKAATSNWLVPIRLTTAGTILLVMLYVRDRGRIFDIWKNRRSALSLVLYGLIGMMACQYTYFTTIQYSNAGIATVIQYLSPVLILIYVCLRGRRLPRISELCALFLAVLGTFLLATHGDLHSFAISGKALFWGLLAALSAAFYTLQSDLLLRDYDTLQIIGWGMLIGGGLLTVVLRPWTQTGVILDGGTFLALTGVILCGTILAYNFYLLGVRLIGPSRASMIASMEPVSATFFSVVWLKVRFGMMDFLGFLCILSTVLILSLTKSAGNTGEKPQKKLLKSERV